MALKMVCLGALALAAALSAASPSQANGVGRASTLVPIASSVTEAQGMVVHVASRRGRSYYVAPRRRNNFGRNVAIGVGAAVIGGILLNEAARAQPANSCSRWSYQCDRGSSSACRSLDRYC